MTWLATQLARVHTPQAAIAQDAVFDEALAVRLKQFQLAQGLIPDSNPGPQTLIRLSSVGDVAAPRLLPPVKDR